MGWLDKTACCIIVQMTVSCGYKLNNMWNIPHGPENKHLFCIQINYGADQYYHNTSQGAYFQNLYELTIFSCDTNHNILL